MTLYLPDLEAWCDESKSIVEDTAKAGERALALFETVDISPARHDFLIRKVVETLSGTVVAETDRGLLCRFDDPFQACLAALNLKRAAQLIGLKTRAGLSWGLIPLGKAERHLRTEAGRRCLRIFAISLPGQILIDSDIRERLGSRLEELSGGSGIMVSEPTLVDLKGVGYTKLMELTTSDKGYSAPTEEHVPMVGDVEVSPVQYTRYPDDSEPEQYLICDTCKKTLSVDGQDGMMVIEREGDVIKKFHLFHKGDCDTLKSQSWRDLNEFTNPECYVQFVIALLNNWANRQLKIEDAGGLVRLLMGMYRRVFRRTTSKEHLNFIGVMQLMYLIGE